MQSYWSTLQHKASVGSRLVKAGAVERRLRHPHSHSRLDSAALEEVIPREFHDAVADERLPTRVELLRKAAQALGVDVCEYRDLHRIFAPLSKVKSGRPGDLMPTVSPAATCEGIPTTPGAYTSAPLRTAWPQPRPTMTSGRRPPSSGRADSDLGPDPLITMTSDKLS